MLKEAEKDLENLCDANVVRFCTPSGHKLYRRLLLRTVALENHVPYVMAGLNDTTMVFKERIFYMLRLKELKNNLLPGVLLCVLLLAFNISVVFSASIPEASYGETPSLINQNSTSADVSQNIGFTDSDHSAASDNTETVSSDFSDSKAPQTVSPTSYTDGGSSQTDQEKNAEYELYTDDTVNVRSLPSMNGSILHTLPLGNAVTVTGASQDGWLPVTVGGISGYIREDYLTGDKPLTGNTGTPADPAAEHPAENAVTGNAAQQNLTPQTDAAASGAVQDSLASGEAISDTDATSENTQQNTFNVFSVGPSERQWLFSFNNGYDSRVVLKGSDGTGNWYDFDGISYGNLDALGPNDPIYNERGEVYYRNLTLAKQAANLSSPSEVNDPYDLYIWDSQVETYIPYQRGDSEGLPIGRGNGWCYYDTASGSYLPW